jgi:hypothetical protein
MQTLTQLFELSGTYDAACALEFVGPEGFIHGWICVDPAKGCGRPGIVQHLRDMQSAGAVARASDRSMSTHLREHGVSREHVKSLVTSNKSLHEAHMRAHGFVPANEAPGSTRSKRLTTAEKNAKHFQSVAKQTEPVPSTEVTAAEREWTHLGTAGLPGNHTYKPGDRFIGTHPTMGTVEGRITRIRSGGNVSGKVTSGEHAGERVNIHRAHITHIARGGGESGAPSPRPARAARTVREAKPGRLSQAERKAARVGSEPSGTPYRVNQRVRTHHAVYGNTESTITAVHKNGSVVATVHHSSGDVPNVAFRQEELGRLNPRRPSATRTTIAMRPPSGLEAGMYRALTSLRENHRTGWHEIAGTLGKVKFVPGGDRWLVQFGPAVARYPSTETAANALINRRHMGEHAVRLRSNPNLIKITTPPEQQARNDAIAKLTPFQRREYRRLRNAGASYHDAMVRVGGTP